MSFGATVGRKIVKQIGKKLTKLSLKKAGSRIVGKINVKSRFWNRAFEHIALHFKPVAGKVSHAVFEPAFRSRTAVEKLIKSVVSKASRAPVLTKATIDGVPLGKPVVILEKEFSEVIGKITVEQSGKLVEKPLKILRVIVDYTGKPITAYPVEKFFGAAALTGGVTMALEGEAEAAPVVDVVQQVYAEEEQAVNDRIEAACAPKNAVESILDFIFDPSCIAPDPHELASGGTVEARANAAVQRIEARLNIQFDGETAAGIKEDVRRIWGRSSPFVE